MVNKNKKNILVHDIAKYCNDAEKCYEAALTLYGQIQLDLLKETVHKINIALMDINKLHNKEFWDERKYGWKVEDELEQVTLNEDDLVDWKVKTKIGNFLAILKCIVKHGKNYLTEYME